MHKFARYFLLISFFCQNLAVAANLAQSNEVHRAILEFFVTASKDPTRKFFFDNLDHFMSDDDRIKHFSQYLPPIPFEFACEGALFIQTLENLGFFGYMKGDKGFFDFSQFSKTIDLYARFFTKYPHLMAMVNPNSDQIRKHKKLREVISIRELCEDLGLDPDDHLF